MGIKLPLIFNIVRGSTVDGEGIRSVVFMQGCPLRCQWCHNPESWEYGKTLTVVDTSIRGRYYSPSALVEFLMKDNIYYEISHGGVTFSGGEPLSHMPYLSDVAKLLHCEGVSIIFETSGYFDYSSFEDLLLPYTSTLLYDIKIMDEQNHIKYTGKSNAVIIENLKKLVQTKLTIIPRTPLIPYITDTPENLKAISNYLCSLNIEKKHVLLPYNPHHIV